MRARQIVRKVVRQTVDRMFARARHDDDQSRFGSKSRLRNGPLSQSAAVIRPPWDARFSAAFASRCQTTDRRAARLKSSRRRRRPRATGTVRARAACNSPAKANHTVASAQLVRVTHPFHPFADRELACVGERHNRSGKRLLLRVDDSTICSVPPQWTDAAAPDPEVVMGRGRALLRVVDLVGLARLVEQLSARRRPPDV
jgi:Family of unknown function (DUF5372)